MASTTVGIIGGSGLYKMEAMKIIKEHKMETPFGSPSSEIIEAQLGDSSFFFVPRHGKQHTISPSEINFRANIYALKVLGVKTLISFSAVGSLKEELPPGTFVFPDQFIDWTKGERERSFFGKGMVGHVSVAKPVENVLQERLAVAAKKLALKFSRGGSYICIEGPQFSSKGESLIYKNCFGASIIGMTNVPESYLAKEAGMAYATVAMVTDYDCWKEVHCTLEEIMKVMHSNTKTAHQLIQEIIPDLCKNPISFTPENGYAVMTPPELLSKDNKEILSVLLK